MDIPVLWRPSEVALCGVHRPGLAGMRPGQGRLVEQSMQSSASIPPGHILLSIGKAVYIWHSPAHLESHPCNIVHVLVLHL